MLGFEYLPWYMVLVLYFGIANAIFIVFGMLWVFKETLKRWKDLPAREAIVDNILIKNASRLEKSKWYRVDYCSENYFKNRWRGVLVENSGILVLDGRMLYLFTEDPVKPKLKLDLKENGDALAWLGKQAKYGRKCEWFTIEDDETTLYLMAKFQPGIYLLNVAASVEKTRQIYHELKEAATA